jgi:hypothetical protein
MRSKNPGRETCTNPPTRDSSRIVEITERTVEGACGLQLRFEPAGEEGTVSISKLVHVALGESGAGAVGRIAPIECGT